MQAIQEATVQVLLQVGPERLTTVGVARRAGVSVGTLYQYFSNKDALLYAVIDAKMEHVTQQSAAACKASHGLPLDVMAEHLVNRFVDAKLAYRAVSVVLYPLSSRLEVQTVVERHMRRMESSIEAMLLSLPVCSTAQAEAVAQTFPGVLAGTMRAVIEGGSSDAAIARVRTQLVVLGQAYFRAALSAPVDAARQTVK